MDREKILYFLSRAEQLVSEAQKRVDKQRELVSELARIGSDTAAAWVLLERFEQQHAMYVAQRDRLLSELHSDLPPA